MNEPTEEQIDQAFSCETKYAAYRLGWADAMASLIESPAPERVELPAKIAGREYQIERETIGYGDPFVIVAKGTATTLLSRNGTWVEYPGGKRLNTRSAAEAFAREHGDK